MVTLADWVLCRLSGERVGKRTLAGQSGLIDITQATHDGQMGRLADLGDGVLPPLLSTGEWVDAVTRAAAAETALRRAGAETY